MTTVVARTLGFLGDIAVSIWIGKSREQLAARQPANRMLNNSLPRGTTLGTIFWRFLLWVSCWGVTGPGALFERWTECEARIYVRKYPGNQPVKSYKVPAVITKGESYRICEAYMPNGGVIAFEDTGTLVIGPRCWGNDTSGREWGIELTTEFAP